MIKFLETFIQGTFICVIKAVYSKPIVIANIKLKGGKLKAIPVKSETRWQQQSSIQYLKVLEQTTKGDQGEISWKGRSQKYLYLQILYISNTRESIGKLLQLINTLSEIAGYKIKSQKSVAFLYTKHKHTAKEIRETTPFTVA